MIVTFPAFTAVAGAAVILSNSVPMYLGMSADFRRCKPEETDWHLAYRI